MRLYLNYSDTDKFRDHYNDWRTLHLPKKPTMKHAISKMLLLFAYCQNYTKREILDAYHNDRKIREAVGSVSVTCNDYWSDLSTALKFIAYKRNGRRVEWSLTENGVMFLTRAMTTPIVVKR